MSDLLLLSGGIDSAVAAALSRPAATLAIDYGQVPAAGELAAAAAVAEALGLQHTALRADCSVVGSGLLSGGEANPVAPSSEWWPYRNQLLITLAAAWALSRGYTRLLIGSVSSDGFHRDGQAGFFDLADKLVCFQEGALRVVAPLIELSTVQACRSAAVDRALLGWTFSCHRSSIACGDCPGCNKRRGVLRELGFV